MATGRPWCRGLPAAVGRVLILREDQAGPRGQPRPAALPGLHAAWRLVLACLPGMRRGSEDPGRPTLQAVRAAAKAGRAARRQHRGHPARAAGVLRQPGRHRPPGDRAGLAGQQQGLHRAASARRR
jgi:hypothetical protein